MDLQRVLSAVDYSIPLTVFDLTVCPSVDGSVDAFVCKSVCGIALSLAVASHCVQDGCSRALFETDRAERAAATVKKRATQERCWRWW